MILVLDHRDSFTWNLVHGLGQHAEVAVLQGEGASLSQVLAMGPSGVVFSPGPGTPDPAGNSCQLVRSLLGRVPLLGVCLGHQMICTALGGRVVRAERPVHGRAVSVTHDGLGLFAGLPSPQSVGLYNSLVVDPASLPVELEPTAFTGEGVLMGVRHRSEPAESVQFHPDSFLTPAGAAMLRGFAARATR